ncbi:MAG: hypothetical protein HRT36_03715 [Alphaproteobacteria bacterium]|nr:hypothetical protein [Alphaproteobacteria bacterium]
MGIAGTAPTGLRGQLGQHSQRQPEKFIDAVFWMAITAFTDPEMPGGSKLPDRLFGHLFA